MDVYELSAALLVAKKHVEDGNSSLEHKKYNNAKALYQEALSIYRTIINEADCDDPKGAYYGRFSHIAARLNILKVSEKLKNLKKHDSEDENLEDILEKVDVIKVSEEERLWFNIKTLE